MTKHFFTQLICLPQQHFVIKILVFILMKCFFGLRDRFSLFTLRISTLLYNDPAANQDHCGKCPIEHGASSPEV